MIFNGILACLFSIFMVLTLRWKENNCKMFENLCNCAGCGVLYWADIVKFATMDFAVKILRIRWRL